MDELLECKICGFKSKQLQSHIIRTHKITTAEYRNIYGKNLKLVIGAGKQYSIEYWLSKGCNRGEAEQMVCDAKSKFTKVTKGKGCQEYNFFTPSYWIKYHNMSYDDAVIKISELQKEYSSRSSKFKNKTHTISTKNRISKSVSNLIRNTHGVEKWVSHFGVYVGGISKIQHSCANKLSESIGIQLQENVRIGNFIVDMLYNNKVIEFYGDYWHCNPKRYLKNDIVNFPSKSIRVEEIWSRDRNREDYIRSHGYDFFIIWENDWLNNKFEIIQRVKKFIEI